MPSLEEALSCRVCFEAYQADGTHIPKLLPCFHTFCQACTLRVSPPRCPTCRHVFDPHLLCANYSLVQVIEAHNRYSPEPVAVVEEGNHRVLKEPELLEPSGAPRSLNCSIHVATAVDGFCHDCNQLLCLLCVQSTHTHHDIELLNAAPANPVLPLVPAQDQEGMLDDSAGNEQNRLHTQFRSLQSELEVELATVPPLCTREAEDLRLDLTHATLQACNMQAQLQDLVLSPENVPVLWAASSLLKSLQNAQPCFATRRHALQQHEVRAMTGLALSEPLVVEGARCSLNYTPPRAPIIACAHSSTAKGRNLALAPAGTRSSFTVTLRTSAGVLLSKAAATRGNPQFHIDLTLRAPSGRSSDASLHFTVRCLGDVGVFAVQYTVAEDARLIGHNVLASVRVHGRDVPGSPFTIPVVGRQIREHVVQHWGSKGYLPGQFLYPQGLAAAMHGSTTELYACDFLNHRIQVFTAAGAFLRTWGKRGVTAGLFCHPIDVAVARGYVYVCDEGNHRIQVFTRTGTFVRMWGQRGYAVGELFNPFAVAVDTQDHVYVVDQSNHRVQTFNSAGNLLLTFGSRGSEPGQFLFPTGIAVMDTMLVVCDAGNYRVQVFSPQGELLWKWGVPGVSSGRLNKPRGVLVHDGRVFVSDLGNCRVQIFSLKGVYEFSWNQTQKAHPVQPAGLAIAGGRLYFSDHGGHCIRHVRLYDLLLSA